MKKILHVTGHEKAPAVSRVSAKFITGRWADGTGLFKYDINVQEKHNGMVLAVTFTCAILILDTLKGDELKKRQEHEMKHFDDFHSLANELKDSLQLAINLDKPLDMDNRLEWFEWDVNEANNVYHRSLGMMPTVKIQPINNRPNP